MDDTRYPTSDEETLYIPGREHSFEEIIEQAKKHFNTDDVSDLKVDVEEIQVSCFGYDLYDPTDYIHYTVISR